MVRKKIWTFFLLQKTRFFFEAPKNAELLELSFHLALRRCCDVSVGVLTAMASRHVSSSWDMGGGGVVGPWRRSWNWWKNLHGVPNPLRLVVFFLNIFYFYPECLGFHDPIWRTNIFQMGWNYHVALFLSFVVGDFCQPCYHVFVGRQNLSWTSCFWGAEDVSFEKSLSETSMATEMILS